MKNKADSARRDVQFELKMEVGEQVPEGLIEDMEVLLQPKEVLGVHNSAGNHE
nr:hypothetical protein [Tanacetum cinerariifolium]